MPLRTLFLFSIIILSAEKSLSQFAPQAGNKGTTAIHADSSIIATFSNYVIGSNRNTLQRGWKNIADTSWGKATQGTLDSFLTEEPGTYLLSLGDSGVLTLELAAPVLNKTGPDFAIFENGFPFSVDSFFLEFAFVEVSRDGENYFAFPARSITDTLQQTGPFGSTKAEKINQLAGKYIAPYGVPFDLEDIANGPDTIKYIRLTDVVGSINPAFGSRDASGWIINDPYPTPFPSSGFDLNRIGFIHLMGTGINTVDISGSVKVFPNPVKTGGVVYLNSISNYSWKLFQTNGILTGEGHAINSIELPLLPAGLYYLQLASDDESRQIIKIWIGE